MREKDRRSARQRILALTLCFFLLAGILSTGIVARGTELPQEPAPAAPGDQPGESGTETPDTEGDAPAEPAQQIVRAAPSKAAVATIGEDTYDSLDAAVDAVPDGATILMVSDTAVSGTIDCDGGSFTLDLNGHSVSFGGFALSGAANITLTGGGLLTLTGTGETSGIAPGTGQVIALTVDGANIQSSGVLLYSEGAGSSAVIRSGSINCAGAMSVGLGRGAIGGTGISSVAISGGTLTVSQGQTVRAANAAVSITGGVFTAPLEVVREAKSVTISGGSFIGHGDSAAGTGELHYILKNKTVITGGFFGDGTLETKGWLKDEWMLVPDDGDQDGVAGTGYKVVPCVAKYNGTKYPTLTEALGQLPGDAEVSLEVFNAVESSAYTLPEGQKLIVYLKNGMTDAALAALNVTTGSGIVSRVYDPAAKTVTYTTAAYAVARTSGVDYATLTEALAAAGSGGTVEMLADVTETGKIPYTGGAFTLDLKGFSVSFGGFSLGADADITLTGGGLLTLTGTGPTSGIAPGTNKKVALTVDGANIESAGVLLHSTGAGSSLTMRSGTVHCAGAMNPDNTGRGAIGGGGISSVTISGGTFTVDQGMTVRASNAVVEITGGTLTAALEIAREAKGLTISGGTLVGGGTSSGTPEIHGTDITKYGPISISGGYFGGEIKKANWLAPGCFCVEDTEDGDGVPASKYTVNKAISGRTDLVYDGTEQELLEAAPGADISALLYSVDGGAWDGTFPTAVNAGNYTVRVQYPGGFEEEFTVTVAQRALTITADVKTKTYGDPEPGLTYTSIGLVSGDAITGALTRTPGENAGTYAITQGTLDAGGNYTIAFTGADLTIEKAPATVTAGSSTIVYGDAEPALTAAVTGLKNGDTESVISYTLSRDAGSGAGTYTITPGGAADQGNYTVSFVTGTLTISKKSATVRADNKTKAYGGADPALTASVTGLVGGDTLAYTLTRAAGENPGSYAITVTLGSNPNYNVTVTNGVFTIQAAPRGGGGGGGGGGIIVVTPTPSAEPSPTPSETPAPSPSAGPTVTPGPTPTPAASETDFYDPTVFDENNHVEIEEHEVPITPYITLSLASLIPMLLSVAVSLGMIGTYFLGARSGRRKSKFLGLIPALAAVITFMLTEDRGVLVWSPDKWTPLMLGYFGVDCLLAFLTRNGGLNRGRHSSPGR